MYRLPLIRQIKKGKDLLSVIKPGGQSSGHLSITLEMQQCHISAQDPWTYLPSKSHTVRLLCLPLALLKEPRQRLSIYTTRRTVCVNNLHVRWCLSLVTHLCMHVCV